MKFFLQVFIVTALFCSLPLAGHAVEFKPKGVWFMSFDMGEQGNFSQFTDRSNSKRTSGFNGMEDKFEARQRLSLLLDVEVSSSLSGTLFFEIGDSIWGKAAGSGALGSDGTNIKLKRAYMTWDVPHSDLTLRMGLQNIALPAFTTGQSEVLEENVAAVMASYKISDKYAISAFWARLYNDNFLDGQNQAAIYNDNVDMFGLLVPMSLPGIKLTPWAMYAHFAPNFIRSGDDAVAQTYSTFLYNARRGLFPNYFTYNKDRWAASAANPSPFDRALLSQPSQGIWFGFTGDISAFEPWHFAWDFNYGGIKHQVNWLDRKGWYLSLLGEYAMDWAIPGIYAWYSSGDDGDPSNGSERLGSISTEGNNQFSNLAFNGNERIGREKLLGVAMYGTKGLGLRLKNMSFLEDLRHTARINYISGTNSPQMAKYMTGSKVKAEPYAAGWGNMEFTGDEKIYLTSQDHALELGLTSEYSIYENLKLYVDAGYIALWLDSDTWKAGRNSVALSGPEAIHHLSVRDAWNINVAFVYAF